MNKGPGSFESRGLTQAAILAKCIEAGIFKMGGQEMRCISFEDVVLIHSNGHREEFSKIYLRPRSGGMGEPKFWEVIADFASWLARERESDAPEESKAEPQGGEVSSEA